MNESSLLGTKARDLSLFLAKENRERGQRIENRLKHGLQCFAETRTGRTTA